MLRVIITLFALSFLLYGASVNSQIKQKNRELSSNKKKYNRMDQKLSSVAKKIILAKKEWSSLDKKLAKLERSIENNRIKFNKLNREKIAVDEEISNLGSDIKSKREKFITLVADKFSMSLVLEELNQPTAESVMLQEAYGVYSKESDREIDSLKEEIDKLNSKMSHFSDKQKEIKGSIAVYKNERKEYLAKKDKKAKIIKDLARDKAIYKKRFSKIRASRRALRKKLSKLKIIKENSEQSRREIRETKDESVQVNQRYSGTKTISPMSGSRLIKRFGTYTDPIYKFKVFNKSITLKAPHRGSKVKSVLRGKVVFAENSGGMLGKVVIIAHSNKLHTIYAKLSRLAPGIHVGKRVSKGSIIGKVSKSLMFEVTKNSKHMNPLKLIRL